MCSLPISPKGYPVPWFVGWVKDFDEPDWPYPTPTKVECLPGEGEPDFRLIGSGKIDAAVQKHLCWICGQPMGAFKAFVIGPMCAVNHVSSEPPSHLECAQYACIACPFLTNPRMRRNDKEKPEHTNVAGIMIDRNPGVTLIWVTTGYKLKPNGRNGVLFNIGVPSSLFWYREGRQANHDEIMQSIDSGYHILMRIAKQDGPKAIKELEYMYQQALKLVPSKLSA